MSINSLSVDLGWINCTGPCMSKHLQTLEAIEVELLPILMKTHPLACVSSTLKFHPECCNECTALSWLALSRSIRDEMPILTNTSTQHHLRQVCAFIRHTVCHMQRSSRQLSLCVWLPTCIELMEAQCMHNEDKSKMGSYLDSPWQAIEGWYGCHPGRSGRQP